VNVVTGIVLYTIIWWTVLFAVLPVGIRPRSEADDASGWRGTPAQPHMLRKAIATTLLSAVIWCLCYLVIESDWLSFRHGWLALPED
jgi:predicted secreted protein